MKKRTARAAAAVLLAAVCGLLPLSGCGAKIEVYTDVAQYETRMSFTAPDPDSKWYKWGMDESIWPKTVDRSASVADYKMVYYDPWDAQYLGYLVVDYPAGAYSAEAERLKSYPSTEYVGLYGVEEEHTYELLAVNADPYYGFVYALTDGKSRIIYAEQIFCNYFMDLPYERYMPKEYFLDGFDASSGSPYREKMQKEKQNRNLAV